MNISVWFDPDFIIYQLIKHIYADANLTTYNDQNIDTILHLF